MVDVLLKLKQSLTHHLCELEEEVFDLRCETNILKDTIDSSF